MRSGDRKLKLRLAALAVLALSGGVAAFATISESPDAALLLPRATQVEQLAIDPAASDGGRSEFLYCDARFTAGSVEWDEPVPPPDGTVVVVEVRVATGHPVTACLPATLARHPDAPVAAPGAAAVRVLATLAPMPEATRDAYERCVFILHRRAIRRAHGDFGAA